MTKAAAMKALTKAQEALTRDEAKATEAALKRDAAVARAQETGATYREIQAATGLSHARVAQVIRRNRTTTD